MSRPDPMEALTQNWPSVPIFIRVLHDRWGQTVWPARGQPFIEIAFDADPIQQRCTLGHEYQHLELGVHAKEPEVRVATARWLLPDLDEVGRELTEHGIRAAAKALGVTARVLNDRLTNLTANEQLQLARLLRTGTKRSPIAEEPRVATGWDSGARSVADGRQV